MRKILSLFLVFNLNTAYAVPPVAVNGETQANAYVQNIKVPNGQATKIGGIDSRLETGNTNLLTNPSFEHSAVTTGWTITNATASADTTNQVDGKKALSLALTGALSVVQDSTINAANLVGLQGNASIKIKTSDVDGLKVCARNAGVTSTSLCINIPKDGVWKEINIPNILTATSNGIAITSTGTTGTVKLDDAFVGTSAPFQSVSGAKLVGSVVITGCASQWSTTSTTFADFAAQTGCVYTTSGQAQAPSTNIPAIKFSSLPAGDYLIQYEGLFGSISSSQRAYYQFSDGTNTSRETTSNFMAVSTGTAYALGNSMSHSISYSTSQSNITLSIKSKVSGGTSQIHGSTATPGVIKVWYFPPESKIYSQASQDYAYTNAGTITIGATTTAPTKGTIVTDRIMTSRKGQRLNALYTFTQSSSGTAGSGEYLYTLPNNLSFDTNVIMPYSSGLIGAAGTNLIQKAIVGWGHVSNNVSDRGLCTLVAYDSTRFRAVCNTYNTGITYSTLSSSFFMMTDAGHSFYFNLDAPISGWQDYGVIVGSFAGIEKCSSEYECTDTFSAKVTDGASTTTVSNENLDWINGSCTNSALGVYACTLNSNLKDGTSSLSSVMNCTATSDDRSVIMAASMSSVSVVDVTSANRTSGAADTNFTLKCQKGTNDYKPKTAKVASSIGVPTVPGITTTGTGNLVDTFSVSYGDSSTVNVCTGAGNCYVDQLGCTAGTSDQSCAVKNITWTSNANYLITFNKTYAKLKCIGFGYNNLQGEEFLYGTGSPNKPMECSNCSSLAFASIRYNHAGNDDSYGTIQCQGSY